MLRLGLTGGIASGKSAVSKILAELGAVTIDADVLAREVVAPGTAGLARVVETFGDTVLNTAGELDRERLGAVVFGDPAARARLERIIHPLVRARAAELERAALDRDPDTIVVHDIPLLVETGQVDRFDLVLVVDVPPQEQLRRLVEIRGMTEEAARARIASQADREQRLGVADIVVRNDGTREELRQRVLDIWETLR